MIMIKRDVSFFQNNFACAVEVCSDFVINSYGESWDLSCEKS